MLTPKQRESETIKRVAREYRQKGYSVTIAPSPVDLPRELAAYQPDLVARRPGDSVVVEVKTRRTVRDEPNLRTLAKVIETLPGWRLEFVLTNPRQKPVAPLGAEPPSPSVLVERLDGAEKLARTKRTEAALLLAWSAAEGVLRTVAAKEGLPAETWTPEHVLKELYSLGLMSKTTHAAFRERLKDRDALIHGFTAPRLRSSDIEGFVDRIRSLMTGFPYLASDS